MTFEKYAEAVEERRDIKLIIRDCFENSLLWQNQKAKVDEERAALKKIEEEIKTDLNKEIDKLEELNAEVKNDTMVMTDIALALLTKGEPVVVKDKHGVAYEGEFKVKFKRVKDQLLNSWEPID